MQCHGKVYMEILTIHGVLIKNAMTTRDFFLFIRYIRNYFTLHLRDFCLIDESLRSPVLVFKVLINEDFVFS